MNLEEELNIISNNAFEGKIAGNVYENSVSNDVNQYQNNISVSQYQNNVEQDMFHNNMSSMQSQQAAVTAQPSMVNPNQAAAQTEQFNFTNLDYDPSKPLYERNPLERLSGNQGEIFRIHFLPGVSTKKIHNHYNAELQHNFVCLKQVYGTRVEDCCVKYGEAKPRIIIPVIVMPIVSGQPNNLMPGQPGRLSTLVLGPSQFIKLQDQAKFAGVDLVNCDIIASVDNPKFKSFNFAITANSFINQIPNIAEMTTEWNTLATPENLCKLAGRLITRDEYTAGYANYDKSKYEQKQNTPTGGQLNVDPNMMSFNINNQNPQMSPFPQGYGSPSSPMYQQASYTSNQGFGAGNDNPWGSF